MARIITPLTLKEIRDSKPQDKMYRLYDGGGLQLCIYKTGKKTWRLDYTDFNKKRKTHTIGDFPDISLAEARRLREELKPELESGDYLFNSKTSFFSVFEDWFSRWEKTVSERHAQRAYNSVHNDCGKVIGNMDVNAIEPRHIVLALQEAEERNALEQLLKTKSTLKMCFDFAVARGLCVSNPVTSVTNHAFRKHKKQRLKSPEKTEIYKFRDVFSNERFNLSVRLCTEFILRNMTRPSEAITAEWSEYDEKNRMLIIPAEKMKMDRPHIIPLSTQSIEILKKIKELSAGAKYIFSNQSFTNHISKVYPIRIIQRSGIDSTAHGLRHLASTVLNETGLFRADIIEAALAHQDKNSIRAIYNQAQYIEERRVMLQWWSDFIDRCDTKENNIKALNDMMINTMPTRKAEKKSTKEVHIVEEKLSSGITITNTLDNIYSDIFPDGYNNEPLMIAFYVKNESGLEMPHAFNADINILTESPLKQEISENMPVLFKAGPAHVYGINLYVIDPKKNKIERTIKILNSFDL